MFKLFSELMSSLHIMHAPDFWKAKWEKAQTAYQDESQMYFLSDDYLFEANRYFRLDEEKLGAFLYALKLIRGSEPLISLAWLWKWMLYEETDDPGAYDLQSWPVPQALMGTAAGMFPLVVAVSNLPWLIGTYRQRNIAEAILKDTLSDIGIVMEESRNRTGFWGIENFLLSWLLHHFHGRLFRIGRLQYMPATLDDPVTVYRHIKSGNVIALRTWSEHPDFVEGNPVTPHGKTVPQTVKLPFAEWESVLKQGDSLLDVHIPRGSKIHYESLLESYQRAMELSPALFPDQCFKGFTCRSWMFDPQLREILPETSNLVRFQGDYYLCRINNDDSIYANVFRKKPESLHDLEEETSLQRAVKQLVLSGKRTQSAAGFLLFDDLKKGPAFYQQKQGQVDMP